MPASIATSSRRSPGVRRYPTRSGSPALSGDTWERRVFRNSANASRRSSLLATASLLLLAKMRVPFALVHPTLV